MQMRSMVVSSILFVTGVLPFADVRHADAQALPSGPIQSKRLPDHEEMLRQIKVSEDAVRNAQSIHAADETLGKLELLLGRHYVDAGMYPQAETALKGAVQLLHDAPSAIRAAGIGELAMLHTILGETRLSMKENRQAIALFEEAGDMQDAASLRADLADAEVKEKRYLDAVEDAQRGLDAVGKDPTAPIMDRVALRQALGYALAKAGRCQEAIPALKQSVEVAKDGFGADSLEVGINYYVLGRAAWICGDPAAAASWMQLGIEEMKPDLGWGHVVYLNAVAVYAKFLRERGETEQAAAQERELRRVNSVVDARTMTAVPATGLR